MAVDEVRRRCRQTFKRSVLSTIRLTVLYWKSRLRLA